MATRTAYPELRRFAAERTGVEAVVQRCGRETFDLVLVDADGNWTRWVFESKEAAEAAADDLGVSVSEGWSEDLAKRMNRRDHWNAPGGQRRAL